MSVRGGRASDGLTDKERSFVEAYISNGRNAAGAYRAAYNTSAKDGVAKRDAQKILNRPRVAEMIEQATARASEALGVTVERVVRELACMAFYDPADIARHPMGGPADIANLPDEVRRAVVGWGWDRAGNFTLKLSPKTPSLDLLAKHLGMLKEKIEHSGPNGGPLNIVTGDPIEAAKAYQRLMNGE